METQHGRNVTVVEYKKIGETMQETIALTGGPVVCAECGDMFHSFDDWQEIQNHWKQCE